MARYLGLVLEGTPGRLPAALKKADATVDVGDGVTRVIVRGLPGAPVEEVIRALAQAGLRRAGRPVDLGAMPKHVDDPAEIAAYRVSADFADLPANPEDDFEPPVHRNRACRFLRADRPLLVGVKPKGHIAQYGDTTVIDPGVREWVERHGEDIVTGEVYWKKTLLEWVQLRDAAAAAVLDSDLSFNPQQISRPCGMPTVPLRSPLIAREDFMFAGAQFVRDEKQHSLGGRRPVFIASPAAARELTDRISKGYAIESIYTPDGSTARLAREVDALIQEHLGD